jgi:16S rRNA (cytosine967-C5)-methyltransferase
MRYIWQHISEILTSYKGEIPLAQFLKLHFKQHLKLGSRDRKILSAMAYSYYRCAKSLHKEYSTIEEQVEIALLICDNDLMPQQRMLRAEWQSLGEQSFGQRIATIKSIGFDFDLNLLFPFHVVFSKGITKDAWVQSMLQRPRLFIRLMEHNMNRVSVKLNQAGIEFEQLNAHCISLPNNTSVDKILDAAWYRVQDFSSQQTGEYFEVEEHDTCWDCCAGAGGKSLLLYDIQPEVYLTVSDVRPTILQNLAARFSLYELNLPERLQLSAADARQTKSILGERQFDHIICDVPCSGSGTWARTPEQLYFFDPNTLLSFSKKQLNIAVNVAQYLKSGGTIIYITCSVFAEENEQVIHSLLKVREDLSLQKMELINGIANAADSMFVAVLKKHV